MFDVADWVIKLEAHGNRTPIGRDVRSHTIFGLLAAPIGCAKAGAAPPGSKVGKDRADHFYQPWRNPRYTFRRYPCPYRTLKVSNNLD